MIKIKLTTYSSEWDFLRQTPQNSGIFGNCQFFINQEVGDCDFWIVFEGLTEEEKTVCPKENTILITGEPPSIKKYSPKFVKQFGTVITCHRKMKHPNKIYSQQGLPWMVGGSFIKNQKQWLTEFTKSYDELKELQLPKKTKLLSVISSNKTMTKGHQKRLEFVNKLKEHFGEKIDVFGNGLNDFEDKWDVIAPYQYHIVIENCQQEDYWTEKLADCFLAESYPFYSGCPNIDDYFSKKAYTSINLDNPKDSIELIEKVIQNNFYENSLEELKNAKNLVLDKYNLFALINEFVLNKSSSKCSKELLIIKLENNETSCLLKKLSYLRQITQKLIWKK